MADDRYQHQTRIVKAYRWLLWRPLYFVLGLGQLLLWALRGAPPAVWPAVETAEGFLPEYRESRAETARSIVSVYRSLADSRMRHYFTTDEVLADLRAKAAAGEAT